MEDILKLNDKLERAITVLKKAEYNLELALQTVREVLDGLEEEKKGVEYSTSSHVISC
jgi:exonuclease VII small subunit